MSDNTISENAIVIERTFDAPVDLIWSLWTQPEHFKNWYGPQGFMVPVAELDVRVGGKRLVCMASPDGSMTMWTTGIYKAVIPHERLVYTESMCDKDGNVITTDNGHPATTEVTVLLEDLGERTRMTMTHAGVPADSPGTSGWEQAFAKLADYIKTVTNGQ